MDTYANVKAIVATLRHLEREGFERDAGDLGEYIHDLMEAIEEGHPVPSNIDELWLETEAVS